MNTQGNCSTICRKVFCFLGRVEELFLMTCFSIIGLVLFIQVILRYFFNFPLTWSEELARYLLVWITFFGINYGIRKKKHIEMEYFFNKMPEMLQTFLTLATQLVILFIMWKLFGSTLRFVRAQMLIESSAMQVSMGLVYAAIPLGFLTSSISIFMNAVGLVRKSLTRHNQG